MNLFKKHLRFFTLLVLIAGFGPLLFSQKDPAALTFKSIKFTPPNPKHLAIKDGVELYYKENHEFPVVQILIGIEAGTAFEPKGKEGLASLTWRLLKNGGTTNRKAAEIGRQLDFLGSSVTISANERFAEISIRTLSMNFNQTWEIVTDMLLNPVFSEEGLEMEKRLHLEHLARKWKNPSSVAKLVFKDLVYGKGSPVNRRPTARIIVDINRDEIHRFYRSHIRTSRVIVSLAGDYQHNVAIGALRKTFNRWEIKQRPFPPVGEVKLASKPGIYLVNKRGLSQAVILAGHLGIGRLDRDNVEMAVLNSIYGKWGGFSRLTKEIREKRGLAYEVYGHVERGTGKGIFINSCVTANASTGEVIKQMRGIMTDLVSQPVTDQELKSAVDHQVNSFVHWFNSSYNIILERVKYQLNGYPDDYLDTYISRIKKVDKAKVLEMARRVIHPDQLIILVIGEKREILPQLKALNLGKIKEIAYPRE